MSEQLSIEILREKFKEAQAKGEALIIEHNCHVDMTVIAIGDNKIFVSFIIHGTNIKNEEAYHIDYFQKWKIKQPKDEYEVLYENLTFMKEIGAYRVGFDKDPMRCIDSSFTGRKLLRNKRTGEMVEYDQELLK